MQIPGDSTAPQLPPSTDPEGSFLTNTREVLRECALKLPLAHMTQQWTTDKVELTLNYSTHARWIRGDR